MATPGGPSSQTTTEIRTIQEILNAVYDETTDALNA